MKDELKIFSEENYIYKQYLLNIYSHSTAELIWQDILKEREYYRYELDFDERGYYLTMNISLFYKILRLYELKVENHYECVSMRLFMERYQTYTNRCRIIKLMEEHDISMKQKMVSFLCGEELFIIKLFVSLVFQNEIVVSYLLCLYHKESWYYALQSYQKQTGIKKMQDLTYEFRSFLEHLYFHLSDSVLPLSYSSMDECTLNELLLRFPMCSIKQLQFYIAHSNKSYYYTITQYMEYNNVSYETARKAMHLMTSLGFYTSLKVGKKQVFKPL